MAINPAESNDHEVVGAGTIKRIAWLTPTIGLATALFIWTLVRRWDWALGVAIGSGIAWVNFRLLRHGAEALLFSAARHHKTETPRKPLPAYVAAVLRYGLIGLGVYVIFKFLQVPLASLIAGLCALAAAMMVATVWTLISPEDQVGKQWKKT